MSIILELLSNRRRIAAIKRAQDAYNLRLATDHHFALSEAKHDRHARLGEWILPEHGTRVLELGCGPGRYVAMLAAMGCEVTGVDPLAFDTWPSLQKTGCVRLLEGVAAENLPFEAASFDHVCCLGAILYFDDPTRAMAEMFRVLRPGGRLVLRSVNRDNLYTRRTGRKLDPQSKNLFALDEMRALAEAAGFRTVVAFQYGYYAPVLPNLYWYWANVRASVEQEERRSDRLPPGSRVNNILHLERT